MMTKKKTKLTGGRYLVSEYWSGSMNVAKMRLVSSKQAVIDHLNSLREPPGSDDWDERGHLGQFRVYYVTSDNEPVNLTKEFEYLGSYYRREQKIKEMQNAQQ